MNWINLPALEYALFEYDADSKEERIVVVELYYHSDPLSGYTYPSVKGIARRWGMDRETVRDHFTALLVKRAIFATKKRRGETRQIKVYRLPKFLWQRGSQTAPNKEQGTKNNSEKRAERNSLPSLGSGPLAGPLSSIFSSSSFPKTNSEPAYWEEARQLGADNAEITRIEDWIRQKGDEPTRALVLNILRKNPPGAPKRRRGPRIDLDAAARASIARADAENGLTMPPKDHG